MLTPFSIVVDAETTSTHPNAKVSEFSALIFDHSSKQVVDHIQLHFDLNTQTGHEDAETLKWREDNDVGFGEPSFHSNHATLSTFLNFIHQYTKNLPAFSIYANGSNFDFPILQNLIHDVNFNSAEGQAELASDWNFHKEMCLRSIALALFTKDQYKQLKEDSGLKVQQTLDSIEHSSPRLAHKHNSLHDCIFEAWMLDACYEKLK